ncbi:MAG: hypothetical protein LUH54_01455 [Firmicutes bacterium]|nr:hypothetical protein [Bacillota bacterium]
MNGTDGEKLFETRLYDDVVDSLLLYCPPNTERRKVEMDSKLIEDLNFGEGGEFHSYIPMVLQDIAEKYDVCLHYNVDIITVGDFFSVVLENINAENCRKENALWNDLVTYLIKFSKGWWGLVELEPHMIHFGSLLFSECGLDTGSFGRMIKALKSDYDIRTDRDWYEDSTFGDLYDYVDLLRVDRSSSGHGKNNGNKDSSLRRKASKLAHRLFGMS